MFFTVVMFDYDKKDLIALMDGFAMLEKEDARVAYMLYHEDDSEKLESLIAEYSENVGASLKPENKMTLWGATAWKCTGIPRECVCLVTEDEDLDDFCQRNGIEITE